MHAVLRTESTQSQAKKICTKHCRVLPALEAGKARASQPYAARQRAMAMCCHCCRAAAAVSL